MGSSTAQAHWHSSIRELEEELCDARAICLAQDETNGNIYRLFFSASFLDSKDKVAKEIPIFDEYDLKKRSDSRRLARNIVALFGQFPESLRDLREGVSFTSKEESEGPPVLIRINTGKRKLPYIEILHRRLPGQMRMD